MKKAKWTIKTFDSTCRIYKNESFKYSIWYYGWKHFKYAVAEHTENANEFCTLKEAKAYAETFNVC